MERVSKCTNYNVGQETYEMRKKFQGNSEAIIYKLKEQECKPFLSSCGFYIVLMVFVSSIFSTFVIYFTDVYDSSILSILALKEDGLVFNVWNKPTFPFYVNLYPFNYTNIDAFLAGKEKAKLQELGPYVFEERSIMTNLKFDGKEFLTYSENRTHDFLPERSVGSLNDTIVTPNVVYISAVSLFADDGMMKQMSISALLTALQTEIFSTVSVDKLIFGFDDKFSHFAKRLQKDPSKAESYGLLAPRNGIAHDKITINTGSADMSKFGIVQSFNGKEELNWNGPTCNDLHGSDTTLFPPNDAMSDHVEFFNGVFCRKIRANYHSESKVNGYPARRFVMPPNVYDNGTDNPDNACFCKENCPPSGAFLTSRCIPESPPLAISFPHFLHGSKELLENFEGLKPNPEAHSFYLDIHEAGIPLGGRTRVQLNIVVGHAKYMHHLKGLKNGLVLPIAWLDIEIGKMNGVANMLLWNVTYTRWFVKMCLKWGCPLLALLAAYALFKNSRTRKQKP